MTRAAELAAAKEQLQLREGEVEQLRAILMQGDATLQQCMAQLQVQTTAHICASAQAGRHWSVVFPHSCMQCPYPVSIQGTWRTMAGRDIRGQGSAGAHRAARGSPGDQEQAGAGRSGRVERAAAGGRGRQGRCRRAAGRTGAGAGSRAAGEGCMFLPQHPAALLVARGPSCAGSLALHSTLLVLVGHMEGGTVHIN